MHARSGLSPHERLRRQCVFRSPLLDIGLFRAPPGSDLFGAQQPPGHFAIAFPETSVRIRPRRGQAFVTDRNLVTLYEPEDEYDRELVDPQGDRCAFLSPSAALAEEFAISARLGDGGRLFGRPHVPCPPTAFRQQRDLVAALIVGRGVPADVVEDTVLEILDGVAREGAALAEAGELRPAARRQARRAREFLAEHFAEAPSLATIAVAAGCSPFHLHRVFRRRYGVTPHRYRVQLALRAALDRIAESDERLLDIALDLGFASHSHLTSTFSRGFGVTPSTLRQRLH